MQVWPTAVGTVPTTASSSWRIWRFRPVYKELIRRRCVTPSNASSLWDRFDTFPLPVTNTFAQFSVTCAVTVWFMFRICVRKGEMCWLRSWDTWWIKRCSPRQLPLKRLCCGWMWGHTYQDRWTYKYGHLHQVMLNIPNSVFVSQEILSQAKRDTSGLKLEVNQRWEEHCSILKLMIFNLLI